MSRMIGHMTTTLDEVQARVEIVRQRPRVVELRIRCEEGITSDQLRALQLGALTKDARLAGLAPYVAETESADSWMPVHRGVRPTNAQFRAFARIYLAELADRPHGAITRAARATGMNRTTAHRWLATCRGRGYLPPVDA